MKSLRFTARIISIFLITIFLSGCGQDWSWHQKLTVSVETPEGLKEGSAVSEIEVSLLSENVGLGDFRGSSSSSLKGEAVVVDLGGGRYLFALLKGYGHETALHAFADAGFVPQPKGREALEKIYGAFETLHATTELSSDRYPLLVTFDDIDDPASVKRVDPNDFAATFGLGYHLQSITLSITDEPVTKGKVEAVLRWLGLQSGRIKPTYKKFADELAVEETLYAIDFKTR
ncbi:hypothetical protein [Rhizobium sp. L1K21]|uniref:hypothetical protein n=1 Tax=Rhizobium sp. L1K21 TaxID=2954933 RepID=UPI0020931970|nr:hypothetical protein [Rhizobium sp. L1K21]MCO6185440.1 hypothetical protein [Rhizobium sp. L1K21]